MCALESFHLGIFILQFEVVLFLSRENYLQGEIVSKLFVSCLEIFVNLQEKKRSTPSYSQTKILLRFVKNLEIFGKKTHK